MNFLITTTAKYRQVLVSTRSLYIGQVPVVVLLLVSLVACGNLQDMGADTIGSGADSSVQPTQSGTAMPSQQNEEPTDSGCAYCVDFDEVAEEYEANPIRAEGKYVDEWLRIRGGIRTLNELENSKAAVRIISRLPRQRREFPDHRHDQTRSRRREILRMAELAVDQGHRRCDRGRV